MEPQNIYPFVIEAVQKIRRRLFLLVLLLIATTTAAYFMADVVMAHIFRLVKQVIFISPTEAFVTKIKVSL
ncbi:MAG: twin-arginine translocase subunit TatC, partial [Betaproteobacteria bacterium]